MTPSELELKAKLPLTVADVCFLMSCGIAIENKEVWLAAERDSINPAAANGERVCRVALLKNKGTPRYARFWGDSFDEAQDKALSWIRECLEVGDELEIHDGEYFRNVVLPSIDSLGGR